MAVLRLMPVELAMRAPLCLSGSQFTTTLRTVSGNSLACLVILVTKPFRCRIDGNAFQRRHYFRPLLRWRLLHSHYRRQEWPEQRQRFAESLTESTTLLGFSRGHAVSLVVRRKCCLIGRRAIAGEGQILAATSTDAD